MLKIFVGFDQVESAAWHTLVNSIYRKSTKPVCFVPLYLKNLKDIYQRPLDEKQSNEFSYSRFLVPYLSNYEGYSIYMDCDMLITVDVNLILDEIDSTKKEKAVHVVKHDYTPKNTVKYLGNKQHSYPRKNWSSFVFWNNSHPANACLNPKLVSSASPAFLHRFQWLDDDDIGELDKTWNFLVGEYEKSEDVPKNIHWTVGGPYFHDFKDADYHDLWEEQFRSMRYVKND